MSLTMNSAPIQVVEATELAHAPTIVTDIMSSSNRDAKTEPKGNSPQGIVSPSPSASDELANPPDPASKQKRSNDTASWRSSACFLGRQHELQQLHDVNRQVMGASKSGGAKTTAYPAVLVWGISGTGKSALIDHFLQTTCCTCNVQPKDDDLVDQPQTAKQAAKQEATQAQQPTNSQSHTCTCCYVLRGKYDEYNGSSDPFSAIAQAMRDFTSQLKRGSPEELHRIRQRVQAVFPTDGFDPLINVVPALSILSPNTTVNEDGSVTRRSTLQHGGTSNSIEVGSITTGLSNSQHRTGGSSSLPMSSSTQLLGDSSWNQLQYIFLQFIKAVSTKERPVYLFLDDLQWSSSVALRLLAKLVDDTELKNFLLLGAIRQETNPHNDEVLELPSNHPLSTSFLQRFASASQVGGADRHQRQRHRTLHHVTITNLSLPDMTAWLTALLPCQDIDILSKKLHTKTSGNIFFALQALEELERKNILTYNQESSQWEWKIPNQGGDGKGNSRSASLPISHSIIHTIQSKLEELPLLLQRALAVAAYIGSAFHVSVLRHVLQNERDHVDGVIDVAVDAAGVVANAQAVSDVLEQAVLERLIVNPIGGAMYHFAHDRIQQAAYGMIPPGETRDKLRLRIGHCLLEKYRSSQHDEESLHQDDDSRDNVKESHAQGRSRKKNRPKMTKASSQQRHQRSQTAGMTSQGTSSTFSTATDTSSGSDAIDGLLFVAADHLNAVQTKDHMFTVMMNLEVGEKALQMGALESASEYLGNAFAAFRLVRNSKVPALAAIASNGSGSNEDDSNVVVPHQGNHSSMWDSDDHYGACLRLYRARCDIELSLNHFDAGYDLGNEVMERARSLEDKLPTYYVMAKALGRENRHADAQKLEKRALRALGEFPKRWYVMRTARSLLKIRSFMKKHTNDEIVSMPLMTDPRKVHAMKICGDFGFRCHITNTAILLVLNLSKMILRTIQHGICEESASAFADYGLIMTITGDQAMGQRCADIAFAILDRINGKSRRGLVSLLVNDYISTFSVPFLQPLRQSQQAHHESMGVGEFEIGLLCLHYCLALSFVIGFELGQLIEATHATIQHHTTYEVSSHVATAKEFLLMLKWLAGDEPVPWQELEAEAKQGIDEDSLDPALAGRDSVHFFGRVYLSIRHRRYEIAERLYECFHIFSSKAPSYFNLMMIAYLSGLISAGRYRETGSHRYLATLRKSIKALRHLGKTRGRNWIHQAFLLEAEEHSITMKNKRHSKIQYAYSLAIISAAQSTCISDTALAYELAGEHFARHGAADMVGDYFDNAVEHYAAWGCKIKVDDIKQRRGQFVTTTYDDGRPNSKMADWSHRNVSIAELFGIASPTNLAGFEIVPRPYPSGAHGRNSAQDDTQDRTHTSPSKSNNDRKAENSGRSNGSEDGRTDDDDGDGDNVSVLTDNSY